MAKTPRYADNRYPNGYTPAKDTDIRKTFARERKRIKEAQDAQKRADEEAARKVTVLGAMAAQGAPGSAKVRKQS